MDVIVDGANVRYYQQISRCTKTFELATLGLDDSSFTMTTTATTSLFATTTTIAATTSGTTMTTSWR